MQLDAKTTWWLNFALFALTSLASIGWSQYLDAKTAAIMMMVLSYTSSLLNFAIHGSVPGMAPVQMPKSVIVALAALGAAMLLLMPSDALAQTSSPRARPALTGDPIRDIKNALPGAGGGSSTSTSGNTAIDAIMKPFQDIAEFVGNDVNAAAQLAVAVPELQDGTGLACWNTMQAAGKVFKAHPVPITLHAATDLQGLRLIVMAVNRLCDDPNCTVVFSDGINIVQAASPVTLPPLPSLSTLCSKVAHIKLTVPTQADLDLLKAATTTTTPPPVPTPAPTPPAQP